MTAKKPTNPAGDKPAAAKKKPPARNVNAGQEALNSKATLTKELRSLIPQIDEEGLQFLVEQARVHLYNMQVDALNQSIARKEKTKAGKSGTRAETAAKADSLRVEGSESGSSFYIVSKGQWVMFSRDEIAQMLRIISAPVTDLERREHLFDWIERERRDLFAALPIADKFDERIKKLMSLLAKNFTLKKH